MHPNERLIRDGYDAFARGDLEAIRGTWTDDVEWVATGHSKLAGTYRGADEIFAMFGRLMQLSEGTFRTEIVECCTNDHCVMVRSRETGTVAGEDIQGESVLIFDILVDKVCRATQVDFDQARVDAALDRAAELAGV